MGKSPPLSPHRRRDRWIGLAIILFAFLGCMGLSVWGMMISTPKPAPLPVPISQEGMDGFPSAVQPFEALQRARELTARDKFRGFVARGVRADGTVDLEQKGSSIRYSFQSASGRGPQPPREPGTLPNRRYCGIQHVFVDKKGIVARPDNPHRACGSKEIEDLGEPRHCSLQRLWKTVQKHGFKSKDEARIEYFLADGGLAYRFAQKRKSIVISARDCTKVLKARASRGAPP